MRIRQYAPVSVICGEHETESVRMAAENLKRDLRRVLDCRLAEGAAESGNGFWRKARRKAEMGI